jgi:hypothetical protein
MRPSTEQPISLQIDRLVLHGFPPGDARKIGVAIEGELTRLLNQQGLDLSKSTHQHRLNGGSFRSLSHDTPALIGRRIARVIYSGIAGQSLRPAPKKPAGR